MLCADLLILVVVGFSRLVQPPPGAQPTGDYCFIRASAPKLPPIVAHPLPVYPSFFSSTVGQEGLRQCRQGPCSGRQKEVCVGASVSVHNMKNILLTQCSPVYLSFQQRKRQMSTKANSARWNPRLASAVEPEATDARSHLASQAKFAKNEYLLELAAANARYLKFRDQQCPEVLDVR